MVENQQAQSGKSKKVVIALISLSVLAIVIWFVFFRKTFVRYSGPLPYIMPSSLGSEIETYINTQPSRHVYLLSGPAQTGKTSAIKNLTLKYRANGTLVIALDFSTAETENDIYGLIRMGIIDSFRSYNESLLGSNLYNNLTRISAKRMSTVDRFFDTIEQINFTKKPIIFINSLNKFRDLCPHHFKAVADRLSRRSIYHDTVPIIADVGDTLLHMENIPDFYREIEINEFDSNQVQELINLKAFTSSELKKIKSQISLQGGPIDSIFERLRMEIPFDTAVQAEVDEINSKVDKIKTPSKALNRICNSKEKTVYINQKDVNELMDLLKEGILYIREDLRVKVANNAVLQSLCN
ncbi:hypothetical protein GPJ56_007548 [Histomonas meleagridis]|uniref:uncharacterized protein n=1 Tax=Histomonas meleagridis TaxID=135588 RepID=UPI003559C8F2|nr:hypothetical protein GPJ56_007548 [Histomonas meleagridis]KAH0806067.1 hypothetical protein GO595_001080 [Histomonas meleagridis]